MRDAATSSRAIRSRDYGYGSARAVHFQIEAMRHAYVDRNHLLGDPAFVKNPVERLLDASTREQIRARIDPKRAGDSRTI